MTLYDPVSKARMKKCLHEHIFHALFFIINFAWFVNQYIHFFKHASVTAAAVGSRRDCMKIREGEEEEPSGIEREGPLDHTDDQTRNCQ